MIKVEHVDVYGLDHAVRAMRNPMSSWQKSDSFWDESGAFVIGDDDMALMKRLFKAGVEHRTFARMIVCWMDITAPIVWWTEMDRYTVGKAQVGTSTMHKLGSKQFELADFDTDGLNKTARMALEDTIDTLNDLRDVCRDQNTSVRDKEKAWSSMSDLLPRGFLTKRTVMMSYETLFKIIHEREVHKQQNWRTFVKVLKGLPYVPEIMNTAEIGAEGV